MKEKRFSFALTCWTPIEVMTDFRNPTSPTAAIRAVTPIVPRRGDIDKNLYFLLSGKLWLNEPEMTWRQEMPVPSSEESKIALQSRLGLSPSKYPRSIRTRVKFREDLALSLSLSRSLARAKRRFINLLSKTLESHFGESLNSDIIDFGTYPIDRLLAGLLSHPFCLSHVDSGIVIEMRTSRLRLYLNRPDFTRQRLASVSGTVFFF